MRKSVIVIYLFFFVVMWSASGWSAPTKLVIDGKKVELDTDPLIKSATVFVPLRGVFEVFNATVSFDKKNQIVKAVKGKNAVIITVGSTKAKVNGSQQIMPIPAFIHNNRTMVPLRFVSEALGCDVSWDPGKSSIYINSKGGKGSGNKADSVKDDIKVDDFDVDI